MYTQWSYPELVLAITEAVDRRIECSEAPAGLLFGMRNKIWQVRVIPLSHFKLTVVSHRRSQGVQYPRGEKMGGG